MKKVFFRADAGHGIGYGHFIRTLALADMLKDDFDCTYFTSDPSDYQMAEVSKVCNYVSLKEESKFDEFLEYITGDEIVVLDNYFFTTEYQKKLKEKGIKLVCIDDMHNKHYIADLIINQGICWSKEDYSCETYTRFALGFSYSLLRKPFREARFTSTHIDRRGKLNVIVAFGGSDYLDLTYQIINAIKELSVVNSITAIVGDRYSSEKYIRNSKVSYLKNLSASEIVKLFSNNDVSILPASTMMNEALACGTNIIGGYYVNNQEYDYYSYLKNKLIFGVDDFTDPLATQRVCNALTKYQDESENIQMSSVNAQVLSSQDNLVSLFKIL